MPWEQNIHAGNRGLSSGLFEQAYQRFKQAIDEGKSFAIGDPLWGDAHRGLCRAAMALKRYEEAKAAAEIALETDAGFWGSECASVAEDFFLLGETLRVMDEFESAKSYYDKALEFWSKQGGDHNELSLQTLAALLLLYLESKREQGFAELHARAYAAFQASHPTGMWMKFLRLQATCDKYFERGEPEEATRILNREIAELSKTLGRNHSELKAFFQYQSETLQKAKKPLAAWSLNRKIEKAEEEALFFTQSRSFGLPPEQVVNIISNLLSTRGNFLPANMPSLLRRSWWHVSKSDPLARRLAATLDLGERNANSPSFASAPPKGGRIDLEVKCQTDGTATQVVFEWRLHDSHEVTACKELIQFTLEEIDQTFLILPSKMVRHVPLHKENAEGWPAPQMYNEAIQNARLCFNDAQLMNSLPELNAIGLPRPLSGALATVYRLYSPEGQWAVKCFTEPVTDHQLRYNAISRTLQQLKLPFFSRFEYLPTGIKVQDKLFPVLKMSWVDGQSLNVAVAARLGNRDAMSHLAAAFLNLTRAMEGAGIAHGDLQHGNVLVAKNMLVLVDYDGMFVPELSGRESNEIGHRNYQHPERTPRHFGPYLDNFSVWVIYVSLFVLGRYPELWESLDCGDESLLFKQADFTQAKSSCTFQLLTEHHDAEVKEAATTMLRFLELAPENVPSVAAYFNSRP